MAVTEVLYCISHMAKESMKWIWQRCSEVSETQPFRGLYTTQGRQWIWVPKTLFFYFTCLSISYQSKTKKNEKNLMVSTIVGVVIAPRTLTPVFPLWGFFFGVFRGVFFCWSVRGA